MHMMRSVLGLTLMHWVNHWGCLEVRINLHGPNVCGAQESFSHRLQWVWVCDFVGFSLADTDPRWTRKTLISNSNLYLPPKLHAPALLVEASLGDCVFPGSREHFSIWRPTTIQVRLRPVCVRAVTLT